MKEQHRATLMAHVGDELPELGVSQPLVAPIYQTSAFHFRQLEEADQVQTGARPGYVYSRMGNPTVNLLERALAQLEGAEEGLVTASGMAALTAVLVGLTQPGDSIVASQELYGGTWGLLNLLGRFGVNVTQVDATDVALDQISLPPRTRLVVVETVTNPRLGVVDLPVLASWAHSAGAYLLVDNTFATPWLCRPLEYAADIVMHSLTKFMGGHGDLTGGVCLGRASIMAQIRATATLLGGVPDPFSAWLTLRGLKTLALRVERAAANAHILAQHLVEHPAVKAVYYPGLSSHPTHNVARRLLSPGYGAMLSLELRGGAGAAQRLAERARLFRFVPSLGDVTSTFSHPSTTSHRGLRPEEQLRLGITPGLIRLSVGIEDAADLWQDLRAALT